MSAHNAIEKGQSLFEVVQNADQIQEYFGKFSDHEKQILQEPEKYYIGLASKKAQDTYNYWNSRF